MAEAANILETEKTLAPTGTQGKATFIPSAQPLIANDNEMNTVDVTTGRTGGKGDAMPLISAGDVTFILKGKQYKAIKSISESSGEAQIVLVERDSKQYCLKLYYPNYHFKDNILNAVWNIDIEMVVKLYDYGHTTVNGIERDYELMEYLEGGTLAQYQLGENMQQFRLIALQAAAALQACHSYGIIHKDIKPGNYFFRDKAHTQLVLGDFGISTMMKEGEDLLRTSQARTPAFAAPEMYDDVIDGEVEINNCVDFYSLGITLMYLWLGKSPFAKNERLMMRLKQEGRLPHINELPERVSMIVRGLTSINPQRRWGYEEVERWFMGEDVPVDTSSVYLRYKTFMVDPERNLVAHDIKELVPLLYENQNLGVHYLYSHRLSTWLDECGNNKMAVLLNDIVEHRYPSHQQAGLMAALYTLEQSFPYYDLKGETCHTIQDIASTLLRNAHDYQHRLQDPYDTLFVYLESHYNFNLDRLRSYFQPANDKSVLKMVYEIDPSMPFLPNALSSTINEVVKAYASDERTDDDWEALSDGRLLAWLHSRADIAMCESVKFLTTHAQADIRTKGYLVLYNIDRTCGFDLKDATTLTRVAAIMAQRIVECQNLDDEAFAHEMKDFITLGGRLELYAQLHQWTRTQEAMHEILTLDAPNNTDRYCMYDLRTAAYKLCKAMGGIPAYAFDGEDYHADVQEPEELRELPIKDVRQAIRNGYLVQWLSIFYHEDPTADFQDETAYNQCVQEFLQMIGSYDGGEIHYKRFTIAQEQLERKVQNSKMAWAQSMKNKTTFRIIFIGINVLWISLLTIFGLDITDAMRNNIYLYTALTVGLPLGAALAVRNYFRGNGLLFGLGNVLLGIIISLVPAAILAICLHNFPAGTRWAALLMSLVYVGIGLKYAFGASTVSGQLDELKGAFAVDEDSALNEMLYYTFRSRTFKFKGSNFGVMDDAVGEARSSSTEKIINCVMWSLVPACLIIALVWFHSQMLDHNGPDIASWKQVWFDFWAQIKALFR